MLLMTHGKHLSVYFFAIGISFFGQVSVQIFAHFFEWTFLSLYYLVVRVFKMYILDIIPLSDMFCRLFSNFSFAFSFS